MRFHLLASAWLIFLGVAISAGGENSTQQLWCPQDKLIDMAQCVESLTDNQTDWIPVLLRGTCVGVPGETTETPDCVSFRLCDATNGLPIHRECSLTIRAEPFEVRTQITVARGEVRAPMWAHDATVSCQGFADVHLSLEDQKQNISVPRGRELVVMFTEKTSPGSNRSETATGLIEVYDAINDDDVATVVESDPGQPHSFGSVPLGSYLVKIHKEGFGPVTDVVELTESDGPLELGYSLEPDHCVKVHVWCDDCDHRLLRYSLKQLSTSKAPVTFADGHLALRQEESLLIGEVCGLAIGLYDLTVSGDQIMPASQPIEVGRRESPIVFELRSGISSRISLMDLDGLPFEGVEALVTWRVDGRTQQHETMSDTQGEVKIPPFESGTRFRLRLRHDKCTPFMYEGIAGDDRIVQLMPPGSITARIVGEGCSTDAAIAVTTKRRTDDGFGFRGGTEPVAIADCQFEIPIHYPGTYDVTIGGPEFVPANEVVAVGESEQVDLGDIELERGERFLVRVQHSESPVLNAAVRIGREGEPVLTDESGTVEFFCLPDEDNIGKEVEFFADHPSFAPTRIVQTVKPDDVVSIQLFKGAEVFGVVLKEDGSPAMGETIHAALPNGSAFAATVSAKGEYNFSRLEPGTWLVWRMRTFSANGAVGTGFGTGESRTVELADGDRKEVNFQPAEDIQGRVTFNGQPPGQGMSIGAVRSESGISAGIPINVDETGWYSARLPQGGTWVFLSGESSISRTISGCPCVIDIEFSTP